MYQHLKDARKAFVLEAGWECFARLIANLPKNDRSDSFKEGFLYGQPFYLRFFPNWPKIVDRTSHRFLKFRSYADEHGALTLARIEVMTGNDRYSYLLQLAGKYDTKYASSFAKVMRAFNAFLPWNRVFPYHHETFENLPEETIEEAIKFLTSQGYLFPSNRYQTPSSY